MQLTQQTLDLLACPACHGRLALAAGQIDCTQCTRRYPIVDGLPVLIASHATRAAEQGAGEGAP